MKKLATTLTALVMATGLSLTAQAATKVTTTTKTTTQKTAPAKLVKADKVKVEKTTKTDVKTTKKANHSAEVSEIATEQHTGAEVAEVAKKDSKVKHTSKAKKAVVVSKTAVKNNRATTKTGEVNIDIPAELKIDESNSKKVVPVANPVVAQTADTTVVVPVTTVTQTGPAVQEVAVQPVDANTAIASTTTTVPVVVNP